MHRTATRLVILIVVAVLLGARVRDSAGLMDFIEYWTAGWLNLHGGNPYGSAQMFALQRELLPSRDVVIMMWNPPWTLALAMPLSVLDYSVARVVWLLIHTTIVIGCGHWLWRYFGGATSKAWTAAVLSLLFPATILALGMGQISPLILLGVCGFLYFEKRGYGLLAGACAALTLVKPHWLYLFWIALALETVYRRHWSVLLGAALATAAMLAAAVVVNPSVLGQYAAALRDHPPDYMIAPTAGILSRLVLGWEKSWPLFVPSAIGTVWFVGYWWTRRSAWSWSDRISVILFVSTLTTAYGWLFDQVVFLIPAIQLAAWYARDRSKAATWGLLIFALASVLTMVAWPCPLLVYPPDTSSVNSALYNALSTPNMFWQIVIAPVFALGFAVAFYGKRACLSGGVSRQSSTGRYNRGQPGRP